MLHGFVSIGSTCSGKAAWTLKRLYVAVSPGEGKAGAGILGFNVESLTQ